MERIVVCLNKEDWYDAPERDELLRQITEQVSPAVAAANLHGYDRDLASATMARLALVVVPAS